ncbi:MAG TPA: NADPH-dependent oxidoreductase [Phycisphaerales bacterium]|nr:NADPH-dependent oxidoreductase [Phycisphaerales bacterium]HMP36136.1 NADPH-dependent oxidoreductase [Phycisphaerales bacterium]
MNAVVEQLLRHRSIRRFRPDPVPDEHIREAVLAGQAASTSSAVQAYCAIRVRDPATLERLVELTGGQRKVAECGAFLVICGDTRRHRIAAARDGVVHETRFEAFLVAAIDGALFAQNLCVALESMGYGICYIGGIRNHLAEADRLLALPHGVYPLFGLCAGIADETPLPRPRLPLGSVLFEERYPPDRIVLDHLAAYDAAHSEYVATRGGAAGGRPAPKPWSTIMATKFSEPERVDVAAYYRAKGAVLE